MNMALLSTTHWLYLGVYIIFWRGAGVLFKDMIGIVRMDQFNRKLSYFHDVI
jgi:hypothetical protein